MYCKIETTFDEPCDMDLRFNLVHVSPLNESHNQPYQFNCMKDFKNCLGQCSFNRTDLNSCFWILIPPTQSHSVSLASRRDAMDSCVEPCLLLQYDSVLEIRYQLLYLY